MKKSIACWMLLAMMLLSACGGEMVHVSGGDLPIGQCMHAYTEEVEAKAPTCTENGHSTYTACQVCGDEITPKAVIPATGHTMENNRCTVCGKVWTVTWDPPRGDEPTLQLFAMSEVLIVGEDSWDFYQNSFVMNHDTLTFVSADESIATVDEFGVVTPVSAGETVIKIVASNDAGDMSTELAVTVKEPFVPTEPDDIEIFGIMRSNDIYQFESFSQYLVSYGSSMYGDNQNTTAGPVEIWSNTLQMIFILNSDEVNASLDIGKADYDWYFDFYIRPDDPMTAHLGGYQKATLQAWSNYKFETGNIMYRCKFYDTLLSSLKEGSYDVKLVVRKGDVIKGWCDADFDWTDSCTAFIEYAKNHSEIQR